MDIALRTNDADNELSLRDAALEPSGLDFRMRLVVRAAGFALDQPIWIEPFRVTHFLAQLVEMDRALAGFAELQPEHEPDRVRLEVTKTGAVVVTGEVSAATENCLRFRFATDQTCLRPLIADLEQLLKSRAHAV